MAGGAVRRQAAMDVGKGDRLKLDVRPAQLAAALTALRAARAKTVRERQGEARSAIAWWSGIAGALAAGTAGALGAGSAGWLARDTAEPIALTVGFIACFPAWFALREVPRMAGHDPWGAWLERVCGFLQAVAPDLHPRLPVVVRLDLAPITEARVYRAAESPHSRAEKRWYAAPRLELRLVLADGTLIAWHGAEKAKFKAGSAVWHRGLTRVRIQGLTGVRPPRPALRGFEVAEAEDAWLLWRKQSKFDEVLPDLALLGRTPP
jgi:hypothetical protein